MVTGGFAAPMFRWYVIRTKPQSEYVAASALEEEGFEMFFPRVKSPKPRPGHADVPLFPGYLFLRCPEDERGWPSVHQLAGILGWVRFDGTIPSLSDEIIDDLAMRVASIDGSGGLWNRFRPGERVRVVDGKVDCLARVVEGASSPTDRVKVLMGFLGRQVAVRVPWGSVHGVPGEPRTARQSSGARRTRGRGRWIRGFGPRAAPTTDSA